MLGLLVFAGLIGQCGGDVATVAEPAATSAPSPITTSTTPAASASPTDNAADKQQAEADARATAKKEAEANAAAKKDADARAAAKKEADARAAARKEAEAKAAAKKEADAAAKKDAEARKEAAAAQAQQEAQARKDAEQAQRDARDTFRNCPSMNKSYPHGVGFPGAEDSTSGDEPVTNFQVNERIYSLNTARDRDDDGIACEKL